MIHSLHVWCTITISADPVVGLTVGGIVGSLALLSLVAALVCAIRRQKKDPLPRGDVTRNQQRNLGNPGVSWSDLIESSLKTCTFSLKRNALRKVAFLLGKTQNQKKCKMISSGFPESPGQGHMTLVRSKPYTLPTDHLIQDGIPTWVAPLDCQFNSKL